MFYLTLPDEASGFFFAITFKSKIVFLTWKNEIKQVEPVTYIYYYIDSVI